MGTELLTERHAAQIEGVLGCWDRMLIFGTLPGVCFAGGMTSCLFERKILLAAAGEGAILAGQRGARRQW
jgi:hypothetical protein